jgi:hypothetical protein
MELLRSPKAKLVATVCLLLFLCVVVAFRSAAPTLVARWILGAGALAMLGFWLVRARQGSKSASAPRRLEVVSRVGLSAKCGLALVEVDGRSLLIVHGDGFAQVHDSPADSSRHPFREALARVQPIASEESK